MDSATSKNIGAENIYTDVVSFVGEFNLSIWGTFVATVTLQRSFDNGTNWLDIATYTAPIEDAGFGYGPAIYRAGVKTGDYTSGTINVRLGQ